MKNRIRVPLLCLAMCLALVALTACNAGGSGTTTTTSEPDLPAEPTEGLLYTAAGAGWQVIGYTGSDTEVVIPATYEGKAVLGIGDNAFLGCAHVTELVIPTSVLSASANALTGLTNLQTASLSADLLPYLPKTSLQAVVISGGTAITASMFSGCTDLVSVTVGTSVTSIEGGAFRDCTNLATITVADGNTVYSASGNCIIETATNTLLAGCKNSTIPSTVTSIGEGAFRGCTGLTSVTIPNSVTSIGSSAFRGCTGLTSVTIPSSVTSIGGAAFAGCTGLTSVTIPSSVTSIGSYAFDGCTNLTTATAPIHAFASIPTAKLQTVVINSGDSIPASAFQYCAALTSISIPSSVTSIGNEAFDGCNNLAYNT